MNTIAIGIIIGMPIGIIAWAVGGYLRDKYRTNKHCEMCGSGASELWNVDICNRCVNRFEVEAKKRLADKMFNSVKELRNAK